MKSYHLEVLKQIGLQGGIHDFVSISTKELGALLGMSQQSASNRVLELTKLGMVERDIGGRGQKIKLTETGVSTLQKEYSDYQRILDLKGVLVIEGIVTSGLGEGQYYMQQNSYYKQFEKKLNFRPFMGTLNLKLNSGELHKLEVLKNSDAIVVEGFKSGDRTFGDVRSYPASIKTLECAVVIPIRSHHMDVIEVISPHHLRKKLGLENGDTVELRIPI
ncbi:MAG: DUF120 domain-containing protein [Thermoplasmata archaeon]|nr:DUF120 domain-containing protein [Thermoplasmata archaeon]